MKKFFRSLQARELVEVFKEYLNEERKLIFEEWRNSADVESWAFLKAKLQVLGELEAMIRNEADLSAHYKAELEELEKIKEGGQR